MKNFYTFNLLLAALLAVAAFATYEPAPKTSGAYGIHVDSYEFQDAGDTAVPLASPANTGTARPGDSTASGPDEAAKAAVLTPAFQYRIGSVRLFGREGSRPFAAELSVAGLTEATLPPLDQGMVNVTGDATGYRMLPDGMVFNEDISIVLPYDSTLLPAGYTPNDIVTYYYDVAYGRWIAIERDSVSEAEALVYSKVNHFTDFINAVIKTPEMPETSAFTPTSIKELEAANPLEGLQLIQAPTANNSGTANLSYQLEIPAGRQGMQPNLALTYSSGGGNGWLGVGWDISVPSITVDTRWGVPRYDHDKESEVYLLSGEQLVQKDQFGNHIPMPHRTNLWQSRDTADTRFYPRVENSFDSIVRHGTEPYNYWWSVTDRNGITHFYGKKHDIDNVDYNTVLKDANGNIAHWALTESVDPNGNCVRYYYDVVQQISSDLGNGGVEIYLKGIRYTGHNGADGKYSIVFNRNSQNKDDASVNCRYGFKETSASTLCNVKMYFEQTLVRSFYFVLENNYASNYKTRLKHLVRLDGKKVPETWCNLTLDELTILVKDYGAVRYDFEYYDYPEPDKMFGDTVNIELVSDGLASTFLSPGFSSSALGSTKGKSWSIGGSASIGLGANVALSTVSAGGNFDYSRSQSEGQLTLIDLNGDGLADKVFKKSGEVWFRPQIKDDEYHFHFGAPVKLNGLTDFLKESGSTIDWGLQLSALFTISGGWPTSTSTTSTYFTDINNDGLPDLVTPQGPMFNKLDALGTPTFTHFNLIATTPPENPSSQTLVVTSDNPCDGGIIFDGEVNGDLGCEMQCDTIWTEINPADSLPVWQARGYECFWTNYGKKLYGYRCTGVCDKSSPDPDMEAVRVWVAQESGFVDVRSALRMYPDSSESRLQSHFVDGIIYSIQLSSGNHMLYDTLIAQHDTVIFQGMVLPTDTSLHLDTIRNLHVNKNDIIFFRLHSIDNHSFDKVNWRQEVAYHSLSGTDAYGRSRNLYQSDSDFVLCGQNYFKATGNGSVRIDGTVEAMNLNNAATAIIKLNNAVIHSRSISAGGTCTIHIDTSFNVSDGDEIKCEISAGANATTWGSIHYAPRIRFCGTFSGVTDTLVYFIPPRYAINNYAGTRLDTFYHKAFGPLYRGWGQFSYNNNYTDSSAVSKIRTERLLLPRWLMAGSASQIDTSEVYLSINSNDVSNDSVMSAAFSTIYNPTSDGTSWVEMTANTEFGTWLGYGNITYISRDIMANTRCIGYAPVDTDEMADDAIIADYDYPVPNSIAGAPVNTIRKQNKSKLSNSSYSVGYIASMGMSESNGSNTVISDYMDMNGDGYPDFLVEGNIQYTMPWGGIGEHFYSDTKPFSSKSATMSDGRTFGASYSLPKRCTSVKPSNAKISFDGNGSVGVSHGGGKDQTVFTYMDVNGDGLPDRIEKNVYRRVSLNVGNGFLPSENFGTDCISEGESSNAGMNIGANFDIAQASIGGGLGVNISQNHTTMMQLDMNGDGLPDKVMTSAAGLSVSYNRGNGTFLPMQHIPCSSEINFGRSFSESVNASVTAGFTFCSIAKVTVGVQTSPFNRSYSRDSLQFVDINGDGFVDCVTSQTENRMTIRYNNAGKTNLLRQVTNFTGSYISLDYALSQNSYEQPQRSWNLTKVAVADPLTPVSGGISHTEFEYRNPHYDRYERMQFGYDTVITYQLDADGADSLYRYTVQGFNNRNFHKRGWKKSESVNDWCGRKYIETLYEQQLMDMVNGMPVGDTSCPGTLYVSYEAEITRYYEGHPSPLIVTEIVRKYDEKRNVVEYYTKGDTSRTDEYLKATISYRKGLANNLISLPDTIIVCDFNNDTLRRRTAAYDTCGRMTHLEQFFGDSVAEYDFTHDCYGNVDTVRYPHNYRGQRMTIYYKYDPVVYTYPALVTDAFGYSSSSDYDYALGKPTLSVDINGAKINYEYDYWGRLARLIGPYEQGIPGGYTIEMKYNPHRIGASTSGSHSHAETFHYDCQHPSNPIQTTILCDGLGRVLQTKKDAEINSIERSLVSGKVEYDCFGRTVGQYHPFSETLGNVNYNGYCDPATLTSSTYDILDRPLKVKLPTNDSTMTAYDFGTHDGKTYFSTTTIDANGIPISVLTGTRKQQVKTIAPLGASTSFEYDALGELISSTDPVGLTTHYTYDGLGRRLSRQHPDAGKDTYTYDAAGNMLSHSTQKLTIAADSIRYHYTYNRLDSIIYPENTINNVYYTYGSPTAANNQRGRISFMEDASGFQTFFYGKLGEVVENYHTFAVPNETQPYTFQMKFTYDTWNRVLNITYPDGEVVKYVYNLGGMLNSVTGIKGTMHFKYIDSIHYNEFELKSGQWYGNGARTQYFYDTLMRLSQLKCFSGPSPLLQDILYKYDAVGNILAITNSANINAAGLGGNYSMKYAYDRLYRLLSSSGDLMGTKTFDYQLRMAYASNGRILKKRQLARCHSSTFMDTLMDYINMYDYGTTPVNNHLQAISDSLTGPSMSFAWDVNGNMSSQTTVATSTTPSMVRIHCWDEENRMQGSTDAKHAACYFYDGAGERFFKFSGVPQTMNINGEWHTYHSLTDPVLYASPYLIATPNSYTKHYYAESERIACKVGSGPITNLHSVCSSTVDFQAKRDSNYMHIKKILNCLGADVNVLKMNVFGGLVDAAQGDDIEYGIYYYHPDHLGSASWITDKMGKGIQYLYYLPWGEELVNQRCTSFESRFTFSGKELDRETGFSYFGSRYYNSSLSIWLSVDPMSDKYPNLSPYVYCADNPVRLVDKDGREIEYSSFADRLIVGIERIFNKDFRAIFNELKESEEIYVFNNNSKGINEFFTDGNKLFINYSTSSFTNENGKTCNPKEISGDIFSLLKHETFHALQFEHGEIAFSKNGNGEWKSVYYDIYDELAAHDFQYSGSCFRSGTQRSEWNNLNTKEEKIEYLKGIYPTVATDVSHTTYPEKIHNDKQYLMPHVAKNQYGKSRIELFPVIDWKPNTRVAYVYAIKNDTIFSYALFLSYPKDGTGKPIIDSVRTIDTNLHLWRKYWYRTYEDNGEVCFRITTWSKKRSQKQFPDYWNKCYFGDFEVVRRDVIFCNSKMQIIKREISFGTMAFLRNHNTSPKKLRKKLRIMLSKCTSDSKSTPY